MTKATKVFTAVRLRPKHREKLQKIADERELSLSELLREILEDYAERS